jgi:hypothetical protein
MLSLFNDASSSSSLSLRIQAVAYPLSFATEIYSKSELEMTEVIVAGALESGTLTDATADTPVLVDTLLLAFLRAAVAVAATAGDAVSQLAPTCPTCPLVGGEPGTASVSTTRLYNSQFIFRISHSPDSR